MIVDRMQFRITKSGKMNEQSFISRSEAAGIGGRASGGSRAGMARLSGLWGLPMFSVLLSFLN